MSSKTEKSPKLPEKTNLNDKDKGFFSSIIDKVKKLAPKIEVGGVSGYVDLTKI